MPSSEEDFAADSFCSSENDEDFECEEYPFFDPDASSSDEDSGDAKPGRGKAVLDANDEKAFEEVAKLIAGGKLDKLKVDHCKLYLRKYGLRLTGRKAVLLDRIREHLEIKDGAGESKYPRSSFVADCKGDACTGDVVMFEQTVYDMYNIASRSASGPAIGTRTIAGRIVKESYGKAKQQHTFTIEVLWSTGTKPLLPMQPLLIKGRNLYKLKTLRQLWSNEEDRKKMLDDKHTRGHLARQMRQLRVQDKKSKRGKSRQSKLELKENKSMSDELYNGINLSNTGSSLPFHSSNANVNVPFEKKHVTIRGFQGANSDAVSKDFVDKLTGKKPVAMSGMQGGAFFNERSLAPVNGDGISGYQQHVGKTCHAEPSGISRNSQHVHSRRFHEETHYMPGDNFGNITHMMSRMKVAECRRSEGGFKFGSPTRGDFRSSGNFEYAKASIHYRSQSDRLCRYFAQGRCWYGEQCKFIHDGTNQSRQLYN